MKIMFADTGLPVALSTEEDGGGGTSGGDGAGGGGGVYVGGDAGGGSGGVKGKTARRRGRVRNRGYWKQPYSGIKRSGVRQRQAQPPIAAPHCTAPSSLQWWTQARDHRGHTHHFILAPVSATVRLVVDSTCHSSAPGGTNYFSTAL